MLRLSELKLPLSALPQDHLSHPLDALRQLIAERLAITSDLIATLHVHKRAFDARKVDLLAVFIVDVQLATDDLENEALARKPTHTQRAPDMRYHLPMVPARTEQARPVVVGFGPCGIFAALMLARMGLRPIVLERGKTVRERTKDTWGLWRKRELNPESNVQFGEGGAGTFSDGKLYSQIKDPRHLGRQVMQAFVAAGAPDEILFEAHPHIGTFRLVKVVENLRDEIISLGGEVRFEHRVTDLLLESRADGQQQLRGAVVLNQATGEASEIRTDHLVLALGHSSRDTFAMLHRRGVHVEAKPFSVGFRIEHPQGLIDKARWGRHAGNPLLGAAEYRLVHHATNGRAVYSFCMCPGGTVVAATSEARRVVTNGMSQYSRNERNANSGMVVGITPDDYPTDARAFATAFEGALGEQLADDVDRLATQRQRHPLAGVVLQRQMESHAYVLGGQSYEAPGQLIGDFLSNRDSRQLGDVMPSYKPGVRLGNLASALPAYAIAAMREAIPAFGKQIKGFDRHDAVFTGVETRTSSPVKITRGDDLQSVNTRGLFPAGEGASYAGGILSAGVDGIKVAEAVAQAITQGN